MGFPALRVLVLTYVELLGDTDLVKGLIESCPLLEDLSFIECESSKLDHIFISCPKLKRLSIINSEDGHNVRISCPKLEVLDLKDYITCNVFFDRLDSLNKFVY